MGSIAKPTMAFGEDPYYFLYAKKSNEEGENEEYQFSRILATSVQQALGYENLDAIGSKYFLVVRIYLRKFGFDNKVNEQDETEQDSEFGQLVRKVIQDFSQS